MDAPGLTVVVSCEAGGAQVLSSFVRARLVGRSLAFVLEGPAADIFPAKLGNIRRVGLEAVAALDPDRDQVLVSTSWMPDLERRAMALAKAHGVRCTAFLDHWVNYRERFLPTEQWAAIPSDWANRLPDVVVVGDAYARDLALSLGFPPDRLRLEENHYLADVREALLARRPPTGPEVIRRVLWVCEPVAGDNANTYADADRLGFDEFTLLAELSRAVSGLPLVVRLRPHPNEDPATYAPATAACDRLELSSNHDLLDDIAWADAVVGVESMALVIALVAGKPVFSYFPAAAKRRCSLPHKKIWHAKSLPEVFSTLLRMPATLDEPI